MTQAHVNHMIEVLNQRFEGYDKDIQDAATFITILQQYVIEQDAKIRELQETVAEMLILGKGHKNEET